MGLLRCHIWFAYACGNFLPLAVFCYAQAVDTTVSYRQQIRPILAANCFKCHGPDSTNREADLRLDYLESAKADRGGHAAIVPGDVDASELCERIISDDPATRMPPASSNKTLTPEQQALLRRWIARSR